MSTLWTSKYPTIYSGHPYLTKTVLPQKNKKRARETLIRASDWCGNYLSTLSCYLVIRLLSLDYDKSTSISCWCPSSSWSTPWTSSSQWPFLNATTITRQDYSYTRVTEKRARCITTFWRVNYLLTGDPLEDILARPSNVPPLRLIIFLKHIIISLFATFLYTLPYTYIYLYRSKAGAHSQDQRSHHSVDEMTTSSRLFRMIAYVQNKEAQQKAPHTSTSGQRGTASSTTTDQAICGRTLAILHRILNRKSSVQSRYCPDLVCQLTFLDSSHELEEPSFPNASWGTHRTEAERRSHRERMPSTLISHCTSITPSHLPSLPFGMIVQNRSIVRSVKRDTSKIGLSWDILYQSGNGRLGQSYNHLLQQNGAAFSPR